MSSTWIRKWMKELECPVCLSLMEESVGLVPCGHAVCTQCFQRIQQVAKRVLSKWCGCLQFAKTVWVKHCPVCREGTTDKIPLWIVQSLVSQQNSCQVDLEEEDFKECGLPYPGLKGANLVLEKGWTEVFHEGGYAQKYGFRSTSPRTLVQKVEIFGLWDGKVAMTVKFKDPQSKALHEYLLSYGISPDALEEEWILDSNTIQSLFKIINQYNHFPKEHVDLVCKIVQNPNNWRAVLAGL